MFILFLSVSFVSFRRCKVTAISGSFQEISSILLKVVWTIAWSLDKSRKSIQNLSKTSAGTSSSGTARVPVSMTTSKGLMKKWVRERPLTPLRLFSDDICYLLARFTTLRTGMERINVAHLLSNMQSDFNSSSLHLLVGFVSPTAWPMSELILCWFRATATYWVFRELQRGQS